MIIYRIKCEQTGRSYVGRTKWPQARVSKHFSLLRDKTHPSIRMQCDYSRYGRAAFRFEVLETIEEPILAREREAHWMEHFRCRQEGYNAQAPTTRPTTEAGRISKLPPTAMKPKTIAALIRQRREVLGLSQAQVARGLGFTTAEAVGMIESGKRGLDLRLMPKLADVLRLAEIEVFRVALRERCPALLKHLRTVEPDVGD